MRKFPGKQIVVYGLLTAPGTIICLLTILGFAGGLFWVFDLFSHFRVQYLLSILPILICLLLLRRFRESILFGLCAAVNLVSILPYYLPVPPAADDNRTVLRVLSLNVNSANQRYDLVRELIKARDPDIILLTEVNRAWVEELEQLYPLYPYRKCEPRDDNSGIALYSKLVCDKCEIIYFGETGAPSISAEFDVGQQRLAVLGTHPPPPISGIYSRFRDDQIEAVAEYLAQIPDQKLLLGDLNTSPWSYSFGKLVKKAALVDSSKGRGICSTWPTDSILYRIPIDFCLISEGIGIKDRSVGPDVGSDHFPLIVDIVLRK